MTFSLVARDPETGDLGVAVQSKFLAVGAVVPWAKAGVGAIATQAWANTTYGPRGLDALARGKSPEETLDLLTSGDEQANRRQVGIVTARGQSATFTGHDCNAWAGGIAGPNFAAQGNILVSEATVTALATSFEQSRGPLWRRLVAALAAAQAAGGDSRGQQSAALLIVRPSGGYGGFNDRMMDLRVDDHPQPIEELARLVEIHELLFLRPEPDDFIAIDASVASELQRLLAASGDYTGESTGTYDEATYAALESYGGRENLEERLVHDASDARIDRHVLAYMRAHVPAR